MKEKHQVKEQIAKSYRKLEQLAKVKHGTGAWRRLRGYIDALEWVLGMDS